MKTCPSCQRTFSEDKKFCNYCGEPLVSDPKAEEPADPDLWDKNVSAVCPACEKEIRLGMKFCPHCSFDLSDIYKDSEEGESGDEAAEKAPCPSCGESISSEAKFCRFCGASVAEVPRVDDADDDITVDEELPEEEVSDTFPQFGSLVPPPKSPSKQFYAITGAIAGAILLLVLLLPSWSDRAPEATETAAEKSVSATPDQGASSATPEADRLVQEQEAAAQKASNTQDATASPRPEQQVDRTTQRQRVVQQGSPNVQKAAASPAAEHPVERPVESPVREKAEDREIPSRAVPDEAERAQAVVPAPEPQRRIFNIPEATDIKVRMSHSLNSKENRPGETFEATLDDDLKAGDETIFPRGSIVLGRVKEVEESGRVKGRARMVLTLTHIRSASGWVGIKTEDVTLEAEGSKGEDAKKIGIGAGIGALVGGILGGKKGAATGAAIGGGAGTGSVLATRGEAVEIDAEHPLTFTLKSDLRVRK